MLPTIELEKECLFHLEPSNKLRLSHFPILRLIHSDTDQISLGSLTLAGFNSWKDICNRKVSTNQSSKRSQTILSGDLSVDAFKSLKKGTLHTKKEDTPLAQAILDSHNNRKRAWLAEILINNLI